MKQVVKRTVPEWKRLMRNSIREGADVEGVDEATRAEIDEVSKEYPILFE